MGPNAVSVCCSYASFLRCCPEIIFNFSETDTRQKKEIAIADHNKGFDT